MDMNRRNFLAGTAWIGVAALAGGCMTERFRLCGGGTMQGFACAPLKKVRVGLIGLGSRGMGAALRLPRIPGVELVAVAEVRGARLDLAKKAFAEEKLPFPGHVYGNGDADNGPYSRLYAAEPLLSACGRHHGLFPERHGLKAGLHLTQTPRQLQDRLFGLHALKLLSYRQFYGMQS